MEKKHNHIQILKWHMEYLMMGGEEIYNDLPEQVKIEIDSYMEKNQVFFKFVDISFMNKNGNPLLKEIELYLDDCIPDIFDDFHKPNKCGIHNYRVDPRKFIRRVF